MAVADGEWWTGVHGQKGVRVYLYYDEPGSRYICVVAEPFDIDWVKSRYGGGAYRAQLNDAGGRCLSAIKFRVDGPPKRQSAASNDNGQVMPAESAPGSDSAIRSLVDLIREEQRETRAMFRELIAGRHNGSTGSLRAEAEMSILPAIASGIVGCFQNLIQKPTSPLDDLIKLKQLMGEPKDMWSELAKLKEMGLIGGAGGSGVGDILGQLDLVMKVADRMGITGGASGGGGKSFVELLMDKGPDIIGKVAQGMKEYRELEEKRLETARFLATQQPRPAAPAMPAPAFAPQPGPPQPGPQAPAAPAPPGSPLATPLNVEPIAGVPPGAGGEVSAQAAEAAVNQIKAQLVEAIANPQITGADIFSFLKMNFPVFLNGMCKFDSAGRVTGVVTVDELAYFCGQDPILSQAAQFPRYREILQELLDEVKFATMGEDESPQTAQDEKV